MPRLCVICLFLDVSYFIFTPLFWFPSLLCLKATALTLTNPKINPFVATQLSIVKKKKGFLKTYKCDTLRLSFFLFYYATGNERSQVDFASFEVVTGQRKVEPLCRVCWVGALGGLRAAWSQRDPRLCFSVPDWSPEVFDLAPLTVCSGCFWDTNWPASKVKPFFSLFFPLCNFPSHICFIHLQMVIHDPSLYAVLQLPGPANTDTLCPRSPFHVCCVISAPVQRLLCESERLLGSREVTAITNITHVAAKCALLCTLS